MSTIVGKDRCGVTLHGHCKYCGNPVVSCCNNDGWVDEYGNDCWDWYVYCSSKTCVNHKGEGLFQDPVEWIDLG